MKRSNRPTMLVLAVTWALSMVVMAPNAGWLHCPCGQYPVFPLCEPCPPPPPPDPTTPIPKRPFEPNPGEPIPK